MSKTALSSPPHFAARLWPHRSLTPAGYRVLMLIIAGLLLSISLVFLSLGAWPIVGFLGLDLALIWLAFRANFAHARAYETVHISQEAIAVEKISHKGQTKRFLFHPFWAKLKVEEDKEDGITAITLSGQGQSTRLGDCLNPQDRQSFAKAFKAALWRMCKG
jgi:uncharacterized membrane protein